MIDKTENTSYKYFNYYEYCDKIKYKASSQLSWVIQTHNIWKEFRKSDESEKDESLMIKPLWFDLVLFRLWVVKGSYEKAESVLRGMIERMKFIPEFGPSKFIHNKIHEKVIRIDTELTKDEMFWEQWYFHLELYLWSLSLQVFTDRPEKEIEYAKQSKELITKYFGLGNLDDQTFNHTQTRIDWGLNLLSLFITPEACGILANSLKSFLSDDTWKRLVIEYLTLRSKDDDLKVIEEIDSLLEDAKLANLTEDVTNCEPGDEIHQKLLLYLKLYQEKGFRNLSLGKDINFTEAKNIYSSIINVLIKIGIPGIELTSNHNLAGIDLAIQLAISDLRVAEIASNTQRGWSVLFKSDQELSSQHIRDLVFNGRYETSYSYIREKLDSAADMLINEKLDNAQQFAERAWDMAYRLRSFRLLITASRSLVRIYLKQSMVKNREQSVRVQYLSQATKAAMLTGDFDLIETVVDEIKKDRQCAGYKNFYSIPQPIDSIRRSECIGRLVFIREIGIYETDKNLCELIEYVCSLCRNGFFSMNPSHDEKRLAIRVSGKLLQEVLGVNDPKLKKQLVKKILETWFRLVEDKEERKNHLVIQELGKAAKQCFETLWHLSRHEDTTSILLQLLGFIDYLPKDSSMVGYDAWKWFVLPAVALFRTNQEIGKGKYTKQLNEKILKSIPLPYNVEKEGELDQIKQQLIHPGEVFDLTALHYRLVMGDEQSKQIGSDALEMFIHYVTEIIQNKKGDFLRYPLQANPIIFLSDYVESIDSKEKLIRLFLEAALNHSGKWDYTHQLEMINALIDWIQLKGINSERVSFIEKIDHKITSKLIAYLNDFIVSKKRIDSAESDVTPFRTTVHNVLSSQIILALGLLSPSFFTDSIEHDNNLISNFVDIVNSFLLQSNHDALRQSASNVNAFLTFCPLKQEYINIKCFPGLLSCLYSQNDKIIEFTIHGLREAIVTNRKKGIIQQLLKNNQDILTVTLSALSGIMASGSDSSRREALIAVLEIEQIINESGNKNLIAMMDTVKSGIRITESDKRALNIYSSL